ncbi:MAG: tripartite tricarboxylate transporter substrate binding protein [Planctomycetota bacterium]|jgi:tripartite-type tricarboxylate transporter receptor subunit TctC|nr:tripartite tricarboxylate transporter substrate binding protein [Planctomycetota bacterium]
MLRKLSVVLCLFTLLALSAPRAGDFPGKGITIICTAAPGGGSDALARMLAQVAEPIFGQSVVVVNKVGGANAVGLSEGARARPDGYTVTMATVEVVMHPLLGNVPWKVPDVFKPIMLLNSDPGAVTVRADSPWKTLGDFLADAKKRPGEIKIGCTSPGSIWHICAAALEEASGTKYNLVPYPGGAAPAVVDLLGGHVDAVTVSPAEVGPQVEAGQLRILAVMSDKRDEKFTGVPTMKELGFNVSIGTWRSFVVPKATPDAVVKVLHDGFKKALEDPKLVEFARNRGLGLDYRNAADFTRMMGEQEAMFAKIFKAYDLLPK